MGKSAGTDESKFRQVFAQAPRNVQTGAREPGNLRPCNSSMLLQYMVKGQFINACSIVVKVLLA